MSDWDDLEGDALVSAQNQGPKCGVSSLLLYLADAHGDQAVASVVRTLANARLTAPSIRKALDARVDAAYLPSVVTIQRHRVGSCSCPREAEPYSGTAGDKRPKR